jgi:hypothetical protein
MKTVTACLGLPLAVYSVLVTSMATLTNTCPAYDHYSNPLLDLSVPALLKGEVSPNLGMALELPGHASFALYYLAVIAGGTSLWHGLKASESRQDLDSPLAPNA